MTIVINKQEARERFEAGYPVGLRRVGDTTSPIWMSIATGWAKTFEEFETNPRWWGDDVETEFARPRAGRQTGDEVAGMIFRSEVFHVGNISAAANFDPSRNMGDLPEKYQSDFEKAHYAVWSYATPIAWNYEQRGTLYLPPVRYSITTTRHQSLVARAAGITFVSTESARKGKGRTPYTWQGFGGPEPEHVRSAR